MEKRVLIFTNHFDPEYFKINDIVDWIKDKGNEVTVVTGNPNYPNGKIYRGYSSLGSYEKKKNLSVYRLPLVPRGNGSKLRLILNYLSYFKVSFIFTLFMFILLGNLIGMMPYSFTWTSHIIVTFSIAFFIFLGVTILAIYKHGLMKFIKFFAPSGVPKPMLLLLVPIEIISYLSSPISLSVRLFANMMAGHTLLKVIGGFVFVLGANSFIIGGILPLAFLIALTGLEIVIAFLQAYVFAILTCLYINDAIHLH